MLEKASCGLHCRGRQTTVSRRQLFGSLAASAAAALLVRPPARAAAADLGGRQQVKTLLEQAYDGYAASYDNLDSGVVAEKLGFPALRQQLLQNACGSVLETGVGTGLNLPLYPTATLSSLTAIDLSGGMLAKARQRAAETGIADRVELLQADVEHLDAALGGRKFDTVLDTFSLCVFPDPAVAIQSMSACLKPGGKMLLLEHARSQYKALGWYQDITAPAVAASGKGCRWNDNVSQLVEGAGLEIQSSERHLGGLIVSLVAIKPS